MSISGSSTVSTAIDDTASESSFDLLTTSRFWLLFLENFWGDLLPLLEDPLELGLSLEEPCLPLVGAGGLDL